MKTGIQRKQQELVPCPICGKSYKTGGIYQHMKLKHLLVLDKIPLISLNRNFLFNAENMLPFFKHKANTLALSSDLFFKICSLASTFK